MAEIIPFPRRNTKAKVEVWEQASGWIVTLSAPPLADTVAGKHLTREEAERLAREVHSITGLPITDWGLPAGEIAQ
jgi:hypothetical protein